MRGAASDSGKVEPICVSLAVASDILDSSTDAETVSAVASPVGESQPTMYAPRLSRVVTWLLFDSDFAITRPCAGGYTRLCGDLNSDGSTELRSTVAAWSRARVASCSDSYCTIHREAAAFTELYDRAQPDKPGVNAAERASIAGFISRGPSAVIFKVDPK